MENKNNVFDDKLVTWDIRFVKLKNNEYFPLLESCIQEILWYFILYEDKIMGHVAKQTLKQISETRFHGISESYKSQNMYRKAPLEVILELTRNHKL